MSNRFQFVHSDPACSAIAMEETASNDKSIIALDIQTKLQFRTEDGTIFHEYEYPSDRHIQNCGGYIDKLMKYRSQSVRNAVSTMFLPNANLPDLPVLKGRSILVDILLTKMIDRFSQKNIGGKAKLFEHGCTVAEHYEMIDQMLAAWCGGSAQEKLSYYGLDISPLALSAARILHSKALPEDFQLILAEGQRYHPASKFHGLLNEHWGCQPCLRPASCPGQTPRANTLWRCVGTLDYGGTSRLLGDQSFWHSKLFRIN
jgi:hypothetical protein